MAATKTMKALDRELALSPTELDAIISAEAKRLMPLYFDTTIYPSTIDCDNPDHGWRRKSYKVWGCDFGDAWYEHKGKDNKAQPIFHHNSPYYPYAYPVQSPGTPLFMGKSSRESYVPYGVIGGYEIVDKGGEGILVHCSFCKGTLWHRGKDERASLWYCAHADCNEDRGIRD